METGWKLSISRTMEEGIFEDAVRLSLTKLKVNQILFPNDNIINTRIQSPTTTQTEPVNSIKTSSMKSVQTTPTRTTQISSTNNLNNISNQAAQSSINKLPVTPRSVLLSPSIKSSIVRKNLKSRYRTPRYNSIDSGVGSRGVMKTSDTAQNANISRLLLNSQHKFSPKISSPLRHEILLDLSSESSKDDSCQSISSATSPWRNINMCETLINSSNKGKSREIIEGQDINLPFGKDENASTILSVGHTECTASDQNEWPAKKRERQHTRIYKPSSPIRYSKRLAKKVKKNPNPYYKY
ncbi:9381_t:CDS:2 [Scutellospora calospora]|uniref:9381_t:CDS:1 n=1 Tax=Scutellospora calospora TaxID=85575 RepID=A0ACA9L9W7_9GLOM|nr:9381_t:CDS:2 [Scutellospora calospora]